ncbi:ParB/RepB/Spo0J family partition protein [Mycoplasma sp. P36-A1]|uniref:ParB/RepB/Spo0J family partition protein n=1 Tax=Mycoplasma sp. P36-A1 TaxID=3252900 RepID=UPI003C2C3802
MEKDIKEITVDSIMLNPHQPRLNFSEQHIIELADSINENGLIQPIVVRQTRDGYELVAGERRLRATMHLKQPKIQAIVTNYNDKESAKIAIIENIQRENLSSVEEAIAFEKLIKEHDYTQSQLANSLGKSQSTIANKLRLLGLSEKVKEHIVNKDINERHGRALLKFSSIADQEEIVNTIIEKKLNVAQTEALIDKKIAKIKKPLKKRIVVKNDYRLEVNTIKQSINMIKKTGVNVTFDNYETEEGMKIEILLKK